MAGDFIRSENGSQERFLEFRRSARAKDPDVDAAPRPPLPRRFLKHSRTLGVISGKVEQIWSSVITSFRSFIY
jgi:hypothetical protein